MLISILQTWLLLLKTSTCNRLYICITHSLIFIKTIEGNFFSFILFLRSTLIYYFHRYVKSRCDEQLRGQWVEPNACRECAPYDYFNQTTTVDNFYYPCGLIVKNIFNGMTKYSKIFSSKHLLPILPMTLSSYQFLIFTYNWLIFF